MRDLVSELDTTIESKIKTTCSNTVFFSWASSDSVESGFLNLTITITSLRMQRSILKPSAYEETVDSACRFRYIMSERSLLLLPTSEEAREINHYQISISQSIVQPSKPNTCLQMKANNSEAIAQSLAMILPKGSCITYRNEQQL